jgi:hypothetical protein
MWLEFWGSYRVFRMKNVACWGIVNNYNLLKISPELVQVLDIVATMVDARFSEQSCSENVPPGIETIRKLSMGIQTPLTGRGDLPQDQRI